MWLFIGFAPGFAYMSSPDKPFTDIPRLTVPRKKYRQARWAWLENTLVFTQKTVRWLAADWDNIRKMWDLERKIQHYFYQA